MTQFKASINDTIKYTPEEIFGDSTMNTYQSLSLEEKEKLAGIVIGTALTGTTALPNTIPTFIDSTIPLSYMDCITVRDKDINKHSGLIGESDAGIDIDIRTPKECSPDGQSPNQPGVKLDAGKIPVFRGLLDYFPHACMAIAEVSQRGAEKYTWKGWIDVPEGKTRYTDAMVRHLIKESMGEQIDPDFGLLHAAHGAWSALARLELILLEKKNANIH